MTEKPQNIQLPLETFLDLYMIFNDLCRSEGPESKNERLESVKMVLNDKMEKLVERKLYTKSKLAPTDEERQQALKDYLKMKNSES